MRIKAYILGFVLIVLTNILLNVMIDSDPDGLHHRGVLWVVISTWAIIGTILCAIWLPLCKGANAFVSGLLGGAVAAALFDAVTNAWNVHNQFALVIGKNNGVFFNLTDVVIWFGFIFIASNAVRIFVNKSKKNGDKLTKIH